MTWNFDMSAAPRDRKIWLASECEKVIPTYWDKKREQWSGFATNGKPPIAWQDYVVPEHPHHQSDGGEFAAVKAQGRLADPVEVEPSPSGLIVHKHIFLEDVGGGV